MARELAERHDASVEDALDLVAKVRTKAPGLTSGQLREVLRALATQGGADAWRGRGRPWMPGG